MNNIPASNRPSKLDLDIHNNNGVNEHRIHRENAISNEVKLHSGYDPKVLRGIFSGFLHRACTPFVKVNTEKKK